jgi:hypothetical protein
MTMLFRVAAGVAVLVLAAVLGAPSALAAPPNLPPAAPLRFTPGPRHEPGLPVRVIARVREGRIPAVRLGDIPGRPLVERRPALLAAPALAVSTLKQEAAARGRIVELDVTVQRSTAPQPSWSALGSAPAASANGQPSARPTLGHAPAEPSFTSALTTVAPSRRQAGIGPAAPVPMARRSLPSSRAVVPPTLQGRLLSQSLSPATRLPLPGPAATGTTELRQQEYDAESEADATLPGPDGSPTAPSGSSMLSDGHSGPSTGAYLASVAALAALGLGLRMLLTCAVRLPALAYPPPVPPG